MLKVIIWNANFWEIDLHIHMWVCIHEFDLSWATYICSALKSLTKPCWGLVRLLRAGQIYMIWRIMHKLPWITIFWWRVKRFTNDFHEWRSQKWKSLVNHLTSDPKIVIHGNKCISLFLTRCFMSLTHILLKTIIDRSFRQGRSFLTWHCDVTTVDLWCHANTRY